MADGQWPSDTTAIPTTNMDSDTDLLTAARQDILNLTQRFNDVLNAIDQSAVPLTDQNSGGFMQKVSPTTLNKIVLQAAGGALTDGTYGVSASSALPNGNLMEASAIREYVQNAGGADFYSNFALSSTVAAGGSEDFDFSIGVESNNFWVNVRVLSGDFGDWVAEAINSTSTRSFMVASEATNQVITTHPSNPAANVIRVRINNTSGSNSQYIVYLCALR